MAVRQKLVKMKQDNPHLRFKLESRGITREKVTTSNVGEAGLEQPDEYFVELSAYESQYGEADPRDIVFDEVEPGSGQLVAGVPWLILSCLFGSCVYNINVFICLFIYCLFIY